MHQTLRKIFRISVLSSFKPLVLSVVFFLFAFTSHAAVDAAAGEKLFKQYCTACHKLNADLAGPALKDVHKRRSEEWLVSWIKNNAALRASGDAEAIAIYEKWNKNEMPSFTNLADDDVKSIIAYIARESEAPTVATGPAAAPGAGGAQAEDSGSSMMILWVIVAVFAFLVLLMNRINNNLRRLSAERLGQPQEPPFTWSGWVRQKSTIVTLGLLLVAFLGYTMTEGAMKLGRQRNYQPVQPVKFSHALHAGINQINCVYCHAGAEKGKHAMIPSPNVCMNCHKGVPEGRTPEGTAEIAKVAQAFNDKKPIEWIKIHNLPDHVYFNHAQHVSVGKIACQTCHGPVETMEEVYQFTSLSMGWCINCHRNTEVQFASNDYYSQFEKLHEDLKSGKIKNVTESTMGGTECQKCHY